MHSNSTQESAAESSSTNDIIGFSYINQIDRNLKVVSSLHLSESIENAIELKTAIFYENEYLATLSFLLHGHSPEEAREIAKNIRHNDYILFKIEDFIAGGDVVE